MLNKLDTLNALFLGSFLGLADISDYQVTVLGPDYVLTRLRTLKANYEVERAKLATQGETA